MSNLSREDVTRLMRIWKDWMKETKANKKVPEEFRAVENKSRTVGLFLGTILHLFLWAICKAALVLRFNGLTIWAAKKRIEYDYLWYDPVSCGLNHSYTDLGVALAWNGHIDEAMDCLRKSWKVYPCPHNTSFGLNTRLSRILSQYSNCSNAVEEYLEIRDAFRSK